MAVIAILLLIYFGVAGKTRLLGDPDTLWHIAIGRSILNSGLVTQDSFSFTRGGEPWVANQWLAECLLAAFDRLGGFDGVLVLAVMVLVATYTAVAYHWLVRGFDPLLAVTFLVLIIGASAYTLNARPHIVSIGLLGATFAVLRGIEDGQRPVVRLLYLIPLFVVWSNLHGGVLGGLGTVGLAAIGWTATWLVGARSSITGLRDAVVLWLCVLGCGLALLATPYGLGSLEAWWKIISMSLPDLIIEHAPLSIHSMQGLLTVLLFAVYAAIFGATPKCWSNITFWIPIVWFVLACTRIRHAPLFAIVAGLAMADLLPRSLIADWLRRRGWLGDTASAPVWAVLVAVVIFTAPLLTAAAWLKHIGPLPLVGSHWAQPTARVWPDAMLPTLRRFEADHPEGTPILNEPVLGGFLMYNCPRLWVFIDGRCELYGETFLRDFVAAWSNPDHLADWESEYGFCAALLENGSPLEQYFRTRPAWQELKRTPSAVFYVRTEDRP